jgi:hypothetical protein
VIPAPLGRSIARHHPVLVGGQDRPVVDSHRDSGTRVEANRIEVRPDADVAVGGGREQIPGGRVRTRVRVCGRSRGRDVSRVAAAFEAELADEVVRDGDRRHPQAGRQVERVPAASLEDALLVDGGHAGW